MRSSSVERSALAAAGVGAQTFCRDCRGWCIFVFPPVRLTCRGVNARRHDAVPVNLEINAFRQAGAAQRAGWSLEIQMTTTVIAPTPDRERCRQRPCELLEGFDAAAVARINV